MEKYGFVYIWYDRKHKRYYVGCHWGSENDGYICSSPWMRQAYSHRPKDFKRRILKTNIATRQETYIEEQRWLNMIKMNEVRTKYYNLCVTNNEVWHKYDESIKTISQKISIKTKEAMQRPEIVERYKESLKSRNTRSHEPEVREKRRKSMIGKNVGKDNSKARALGADVNRGRKLTEEHKAKIKATTIFKDLNNKQVQCKKCGVRQNVGNIGRYHNEKCKKVV